MFKSKKIITGIELGTSKISAIVAELCESGEIKVLQYATESSDGAIIKGEVTDVEKATEVLKKVLDQINEATIFPDDTIFLAITGGHIKSQEGIGTVHIHSEDRKIREDDVVKATKDSMHLQANESSEIINSISSYFRLDDKHTLRTPEGHEAYKLSAHSHIIYGNNLRISSFSSILERVGLDHDKVHTTFSGLASMFGVLTEQEKEEATLIIDLGAGTTEYILIHYNGILNSGVLPLGVEHVINDISVVLDINEKKVINAILKENCLDVNNSMTGMVEITTSGGKKTIKIPSSSFVKIANHRLEEIFKLIKKDFDDATGVNLPKNIVITGGGAKISGITDILKSVFPCYNIKVGKPIEITGVTTDLIEPEYAVLCGLLKYAALELNIDKEVKSNKNIFSKCQKIGKKILDAIEF